MARVPPEALQWLNAAGRVPMLTPAEEVHLGAVIRVWQDHPHGPANAPPAVTRRGLRARNRMVSANLRLVAMVAQRVGGTGPLSDRLQNGTIGLIRAAEKFDPSRGYRFSTYSYMWIRQAIDTGELAEATIRLPAPVAAAVRGRRNGNCSAELRDCGMMVLWPLSLDAPNPSSDSDSPLAEVLAAPADPGMAQMEHLDALQSAIAAMEAADPEGVALLQLHHADGARVGDLAVLMDATTPATTKRLRTATQALRVLPEVQVALAS